MHASVTHPVQSPPSTCRANCPHPIGHLPPILPIYPTAPPRPDVRRLARTRIMLPAFLPSIALIRGRNFLATSTTPIHTKHKRPFRTLQSTPHHIKMTRYAVLAVLAFASIPAIMLTTNRTVQSSSQYVTALTTVPSETVATQIAEALVSAKLVACVNTIPGVKSTYWWQGKLHHDSELLLFMKTRRALVPSLVDHINRLHPYDLPEVITQPIDGGSVPYLNWIAESTTTK